MPRWRRPLCSLYLCVYVAHTPGVCKCSHASALHDSRTALPLFALPCFSAHKSRRASWLTLSHSEPWRVSLQPTEHAHPFHPAWWENRRETHIEGTEIRGVSKPRGAAFPPPPLRRPAAALLLSLRLWTHVPPQARREGGGIIIEGAKPVPVPVPVSVCLPLSPSLESPALVCGVYTDTRRHSQPSCPLLLVYSFLCFVLAPTSTHPLPLLLVNQHASSHLTFLRFRERKECSQVLGDKDERVGVLCCEYARKSV